MEISFKLTWELFGMFLFGVGISLCVGSIYQLVSKGEIEFAWVLMLVAFIMEFFAVICLI